MISQFDPVIRAGCIIAGIAVTAIIAFLSFFPKMESRPASAKANATNDVVLLRISLERYRDEMGAMPSSDSLAIIRSLSGDNPKKIVFIEFQSKDAQGRFLDPWGSPYRIDVSDPKNPRVWSPGKNKKDEPDDPHSDDICSWR